MPLRQSTRNQLCFVIALAACAPASAQYYYAPSRDYYRNDTAEGTVAGGAFGAIAGALIGGSDGKSPEGALIGAATGAIAGNLLGRSKDAADRQQAAYGQANAARANAQIAAQAMTNYDLIQLASAQIDDNITISAIQSRGGRFDLSPAGLIQLKQNGVSDRVIIAAQNASAVPAPSTVIVARPPVIFQPAPRVYYQGHFGPAWRHHHHRHW